MPLIRFLTLIGFAVFVPNVRGSTGYGLSYTKQVDRDWGGKDRLDHLHAMTKVLPGDAHLDVKHSAVVGRSYGGYMTLTMAGRHPDLWSAAVDMFGPFGQGLGQLWMGFSASQMTGWLTAAGLRQVRYVPLTPQPSAKGPGLFLATARKPD